MSNKKYYGYIKSWKFIYEIEKKGPGIYLFHIHYEIENALFIFR